MGLCRQAIAKKCSRCTNDISGERFQFGSDGSSAKLFCDYKCYVAWETAGRKTLKKCSRCTNDITGECYQRGSDPNRSSTKFFCNCKCYVAWEKAGRVTLPATTLSAPPANSKP